MINDAVRFELKIYKEIWLVYDKKEDRYAEMTSHTFAVAKVQDLNKFLDHAGVIKWLTIDELRKQNSK